MKKTLIIISLVLLISVAVYLYLNPGQPILETLGLKKKTVDTGNVPAKLEDKSLVEKAKEALPSSSKDDWPLQEGKSGSRLKPSPAVKEIQKYLNAGGANLVEDGIYGPKTGKALKLRNYPAVITFDGYLNILGLN